MTGDTSTLVYHYTTRETALEKILFTNKLRLNPFICTNDPRESKLWNFTFMGKKPIQTGSSLALLKKTSASDITDAVKYGCKLICFSQDTQERIRKYPDSISSHGYFRSRMWAHYGNSHSGVCFAFDREKLDETIAEEFKSIGKIYKGAVEYVENELEIYKALGFDADAIQEKGIDFAVQKHLDFFFKILFLQKDADWKHEQEYRWIIKTQIMDSEYVSITKSLRGIFLGIDFPSVYESLAIELSRKNDIPLYRIKWYNGIARLSDDLRHSLI